MHAIEFKIIWFSSSHDWKLLLYMVTFFMVGIIWNCWFSNLFMVLLVLLVEVLASTFFVNLTHQIFISKYMF